MMNAETLYRATLVAAATASLLLVACGRSEDDLIAGLRLGETTSTTAPEQKAEAVAEKPSFTTLIKLQDTPTIAAPSA